MKNRLCPQPNDSWLANTLINHSVSKIIPGEYIHDRYLKSENFIEYVSKKFSKSFQPKIEEFISNAVYGVKYNQSSIEANKGNL